MPPQRHLQRLESIRQRQPVYFITACVAERRPLLATAEVHALLLDEWRGLTKRGWCVGRYVVMPDHVHFFITQIPGTECSLSKALGKWKEWTAKQILPLAGGSAPLWQPEFFDHLLRSEESATEKWNYVRANPVRAGLVAKAEDCLTRVRSISRVEIWQM